MAQNDPWLDRGPCAMAQTLINWPVATSARSEMALVVRHPAVPPAAPCPVIVMSHGNGGWSDAYAELVADWVSRGCVVIQPRHADAFAEVARRYPQLGWTDEDIMAPWQQDALTQALFLTFALSPICQEDRLTEIRTVLRDAEAIVAAAGFPGAVDGGRVAVAGHSYGAFTSAVLAGVRVDLMSGRGQTLESRPLKGALVLSPPPAGGVLKTESWAEVAIPMLMLTGTEDRSAAHLDPAARLEPFRLSSPGGRYLGVIAGGDHGFGGIAFTGRKIYRDDPVVRDWTRRLSNAFWQATLFDDAAAQAWLQTGPRDPAVAWQAK